MRTTLAVLIGVMVWSTSGDARITRVRPLSERTATLLDVGRVVSPTIRGMLTRIEASDLILQIETRLDLDVPNAVTRFVVATRDVRYVRVTINPRLAPARRLQLLAHELQHVLEIADDHSVRDQETMRDHFTRIGRRNPVTGSFETDAAVAVEDIVRKEVGRVKAQAIAPLAR